MTKRELIEALENCPTPDDKTVIFSDYDRDAMMERQFTIKEIINDPDAPDVMIHLEITGTYS